MKLAIIGGGGFRVPLIIRALRSERFNGLISHVDLYDPDPERLCGIRAVVDTMPGAKSDLTVTGTDALGTALADADVVFSAIRPGGAHGRGLDETVALRHGVLGQETVGAGGINYALRSIPQMIEVAHQMSRLCSTAWLINFTNPAGMVTQALQHYLPGRVIGICDSPVGLINRAARAAGVDSPDLRHVDYVGLNHLGWLRALPDAAALPGLLADPSRLRSFEEGRLFSPAFLKTLGALPNEYLFYYYNSRQALAAVSGQQHTRGQSIEAAQRALYPTLKGATAYAAWEAARREREEGYLAEARSGAEQRDESDLAGGGYESVALSAMEALLTGKDTTLILNLPNRSATGRASTEFADDDVLEGPATITSAGGASSAALLAHRAPLTEHQSGLMHQLKAVERLTVTAAVERSVEAAVAAMALHPLVADEKTAAALVHDYAPFG